MRIRILKFLLALALSVTLVPTYAFADKDHRHGGGRHAERNDDRDSDRDNDRDNDRHHDRDDGDRARGHHDRDRDDDRDRDRDDARSRPPGWSHGKKTGWGDCDLPPGQAKKHGCHDRAGRRRHGDGDNDRDDQRTGTIKPRPLPRPRPTPSGTAVKPTVTAGKTSHPGTTSATRRTADNRWVLNRKRTQEDREERNPR